MKYIRKTPVEAIQWNGHNLIEVSKFISHAAKSYNMWDDDFGTLDITYSFQKGRISRAVVPLFGWVVKDGKVFEFYKDSTFIETFEEVPDDEHKEVMDTIYKDLNKMLEEVRASIENGQIFAKHANLVNPDGRLTKLIDDIFKDDEKTREEIKKNMSVGLKEMAGGKTKGTEFDTFESVLDEMKELHAKKDKDYGSAFHKSFEEFGVTAGVVRLNDKMERVKSLVKNGKAEVKDESLLDTLKDMSSYAVMLYVELKNKEND